MINTTGTMTGLRTYKKKFFNIFQTKINCIGIITNDGEILKILSHKYSASGKHKNEIPK